MTKNRWASRLLCISIFIIAVGIVGIYVSVKCASDFPNEGEDETFSLVTLHTKSGDVVDIRIPHFSEGLRAIYCMITKNNETIFPLRIIGLSEISISEATLEFALVEGDEQNEIVAVVEKTNPHVVLAICDVKHRKGIYSSLPGIEARKAREELLQRLNQDNPGKSFIFPSSMSDYTTLKVFW